MGAGSREQPVVFTVWFYFHSSAPSLVLSHFRVSRVSKIFFLNLPLQALFGEQ